MKTRKARMTFLTITAAGMAVSTAGAQTTNTWQGDNQLNPTSWNLGSNWDLGHAPTASEDVVIADVTNQPVLNTNATINSLVIDSGADMSFGSGSAFTLTVDNGNVTVNGTLNINNSGALDVQTGTVSVPSGGKLDLDGGSADFASTLSVSGTFEATNSSVIDMGGATTVNTASFDMASSQFDAGGLFTVNSGAVVDLVSSTLNIEASNGLDLDAATSTINLSGTNPSLVIKASGAAFPIDGAINLSSSTALLDLQVDATFNNAGGSGRIEGFNDAAIVSIAANTTFVSHVTVAGHMQVNAGANGEFDNRHEVIADQSGGTLEFTSSTIVLDSGVKDADLFQAIGGATLKFSRNASLVSRFYLNDGASVSTLDVGDNDISTCGTFEYDSGDIDTNMGGGSFAYAMYAAGSACTNPADSGSGSMDCSSKFLVSSDKSCP